MKGNEKIIEKLNDLLADELTVTNQYFLHAEICENWGYERLYKEIRKRSITEMKHAEKLITRILFLEGRPIVSNLKKMHIGSEVPAQHQNDWDAQYAAIRSYNDGIRLAFELTDNGTRELLDRILKDEKEHIAWIEAQLEEIKQMGTAKYLAGQID